MPNNDTIIPKELIYRLVPLVQAFMAIAITAFVFLSARGIIDFSFPPLDESSQMIALPILWAVSALMAGIYLYLFVSIKKLDPANPPALIRFWVRQLHRKPGGSALGLLIVLSALGEGCVILSLLVFLFCACTRLFAPGAAIGLGMIIMAFPDREMIEKLVQLDQDRNTEM